MSYSVSRTMTSERGFDKVKKYMNDDSAICLGCRDYGSAYMYYPGHEGSDKVGSPLVVNKETGKVVPYAESNLSGKPWEPVLSFAGDIWAITR